MCDKKILKLVAMGDEFINSGKEINEESFGRFLDLVESLVKNPDHFSEIKGMEMI